MKKPLFILVSILIFCATMGFWGETAFGQEINTLDKIFNNTKSLTLNGYTIEKIPGPQDEQWSAVLKKYNEVIMRFENGYLEDMTIFGLYPFIVNRDKQLVVEQFSGGAHCCWSDWIIELTSPISILYDSQKYPVGYGIVIEDLDKDGNSEFIQTLLTFDYFDRIPHAYSPLPAVVFAFDESSNQFVPANPLFADYLLKDIEENIQYCQEYTSKVKANPDSYDDSTGEYLSSVLQVVIPYIYVNQEENAWSFFNQNYLLKDKEEIRQKVEGQLNNCAVYQYIKAH
ncbi:MAG TPA: hypothetical protein DF698_06735 [Candidatus Atribacteria bacterium]|nr:hypothetical protein [Candidatus Atribacteria bacterium]